ncbi:MAG TPA: hypothetical protein DD435_17420 [Cyanobacteria bacterium UBA8530]|nr:hypothetical protein [Cyanobacteria bacterium UBA8530]
MQSNKVARLFSYLSFLALFATSCAGNDAAVTGAPTKGILSVRLLQDKPTVLPSRLDFEVLPYKGVLARKASLTTDLGRNLLEAQFTSLVPGTASITIRAIGTGTNILSTATASAEIKTGSNLVQLQFGALTVPIDVPTPDPSNPWIMDPSGILPGTTATLATSSPFALKGIALNDKLTTLSFGSAPEAYLAFVNNTDTYPWVEASWQGGSDFHVASLPTESVHDLLTPQEKLAAEMFRRPIHMRQTARRYHTLAVPAPDSSVSINFGGQSGKPTTVKKVDSCIVGGKTINFAILVDKDDLATIGDAILTNLSTEIKGNILPKVTDAFGYPPPGDASGLSLNGDGTVYFVISSEVDKGRPGTLGFFSAQDLTEPAPRGNQKCMVAIAASPLAKVGSEAQVYSTIAHEYAHAVFFWQRALAIGTENYNGVFNNQSETWLTEGFSTNSSVICGYGPDTAKGDPVLVGHIYGYLYQPHSVSLFPFQSYGMSFLFVHYLTDRYGTGILKEIMNSPRYSSSTATVEEILNKKGTTLYQFFKDFAIALILDGTNAESEKYFIGDVNLRGNYSLSAPDPSGAIVNIPITFRGPQSAGGLAPVNPQKAFVGKAWGLGFFHAAFPSGLTLSIRNGSQANGILLVPSIAIAPK